MTQSARHRQTRNANAIIRSILTGAFWPGRNVALRGLIAENFPLKPDTASRIAYDASVPRLALMREEGINWSFVAERLNVELTPKASAPQVPSKSCHWCSASYLASVSDRNSHRFLREVPAIDESILAW